MTAGAVCQWGHAGPTVPASCGALPHMATLGPTRTRHPETWPNEKPAGCSPPEALLGKAGLHLAGPSKPGSVHHLLPDVLTLSHHQFSISSFSVPKSKLSQSFQSVPSPTQVKSEVVSSQSVKSVLCQVMNPVFEVLATELREKIFSQLDPAAIKAASLVSR